MGELRELIDDAYTEEPVDEQEEAPQEEETAAEGSGEEEQPTDNPDVGEPTAKDGGDEPTAKAEDEPAIGGEDKGAEVGPKPPIDWDAGLREQWGSLPDGVKTKIAAREQQMAQAMSGTREAKATHQEIMNLQNTYGSVIAAEGATNPIQAVQGLLQTATELRMGSPQAKAAKIAELITHFGVDIGALDSALAGEPPPAEQAQMNQFQQMLDQRLAPVNEMMQNLAGMQTQHQGRVQQEVQSELQEFSQQAEFLPDVRQDMSYLMNLATQQGRQMTLKDAYDRACSMNPQVSSIMKQREEQAALTQRSATMEAKQKAGASLPSRGSSTSDSGNPPQSLAGQLNEIWDSLS